MPKFHTDMELFDSYFVAVPAGDKSWRVKSITSSFDGTQVLVVIDPDGWEKIRDDVRNVRGSAENVLIAIVSEAELRAYREGTAVVCLSD